MGQKREVLPHFEELDFVLLHSVFVQEVQRLFPVPTSVEFVFNQDTGGEHGQKDSAEAELLFCAPAGEQGNVLIRCFDYDSTFHEKLDESFVKQLQEQIFHQLGLLRLAYIDPVSGMYNRRALHAFDTSGVIYPGTFFLFHVVPGSLALKASSSLYLKVLELLHTQGSGCHFSLGANLFGMILFETGRDKALRIARQLLKGMKQERVRRVQVALCRIDSGCKLFQQAWEGLMEAERRGPYVVYDTSVQSVCPFLLPEKDFVNNMQKVWRGLRTFQVVVAEIDQGAEVEQALDVVQSFLKQGCCFRGYWKGKGYFIVSGENGKNDTLVTTNLSSAQSDLARTGIRGLGLSQWPGLHKRKSQTVESCLKALLHCTFLDPGSAVQCDALTLNISGDYYFDQGDYRLAAREYRMGLQMAPEDANLLNTLGVTLTELGQPRSAGKFFEAVLGRDPENFMALVNLGFVQMTLGNTEQALQLLSRAYSSMEKDSRIDEELLFSLCTLLVDQKEYRRAVEALNRWVAQSGRNFMAYRLLGVSHYKMGNFREASVACQQALRICPNDNISLSILGTCYVLQGEGTDIGIRLCRQAVELDSGNLENSIRLAGCLVAAQQWDEAALFLQPLLNNPVLRYEALLLTAEVHIGRKDFAEAMRLLKRLKKNNKISSEHKQQVIELLKSLAGA